LPLSLPVHPIGKKNKVENSVLFFDGQNVSVNSPRLPHISPQLHHKNTTTKRGFSQKTPAKTPIHHSTKKTAK